MATEITKDGEWENGVLIKPSEDFINERDKKVIDFTQSDESLKFMIAVKLAIRDNSDSITRDEMVEFNTLLGEFSNLGQVKLTRYPLALVWIMKWVKQGIVPAPRA